jgi:predicted peptidase
MWAALVGLAIAWAPLATSGGAGKRGFMSRVHADDQSKYVLFVPHGYSGDKAYPLILFLHGAGQRGDDGEGPAKGSLATAIRKSKGGEKGFPFFVVFPQCRAKGNWSAGGPDAKRALAILAQVQKDYKIDDKRLYLTGLSLGGFGTWSLAAAHPEKWAAIAPICGGGNPTNAAKIKDLPCWCFHGDADPTVDVKKSRDMIEALKKAGGQPRYTEYPGVGHNSWDRAYGNPELYTWMLSHKAK